MITSGTAACVAGAASCASVILGVEVPVIVLALLGAIMSNVYGEDFPTWKPLVSTMAMSLIVGVLVASLFSGLIVEIAAHQFPWLRAWLFDNSWNVKIGLAFGAAFLSQFVIPRVVDFAKGGKA